MKTRVSACAAAIAIAAAVGSTGTAVAGGGKAKTRVTIQAGGEIFGYVISDKNSCMKERKVALYVEGPGAFERYVNDTPRRSAGTGSTASGNPGLGGKKVFARREKDRRL